jgi:hypothetical protein
MKTKLAVMLAVLGVVGCGAPGSEGSSTDPLTAQEAVIAAAASTRPPLRCGPVLDPTTGATSVGTCPPNEKCCNGGCVIDTALCVAPPPQCVADSDCPQPGAPCQICADGSTACPKAVCDQGQCKVIFNQCPPPKACNPASANPVNQCGPHEACCNGVCQPDGELCKAPQCASAADCKGPLPQLCEVCANGKSECAHWECVAGACVTAICDPLPPGPAASSR